MAVPESALADDHEPWRDEIDFEVEEPVEGRRIFVEALTVSGDRAAVTLRAATALDIRVRAFGGPQGTWLRFWGSASLAEGESIDYSLPLNGPAPSFTVSWEDTLGQAGALTVEPRADPVPAARRRGRALRPSHGLPGLDARSGQRRHRVRVRHAHRAPGGASDGGGTRQRHRDVPDGRPGDGGHGDRRRRDGQRRIPTSPSSPAERPASGFAVGTGQAIHAVSVDVSLEASLSIPIPPLTMLTHHPERVEQVTRTVHLHRPGDSDYDSQTVTVTCDDGAESSAATTSSATATAYAYVPSATIAKEVTVDVLHKEHVKAETVERSPITRTRGETLAFASGVGSDDPFEALVLPQPEPEDPPAEQEPAGGLRQWFDLLGWEWPW